jgi:hypothetical protein
MDMEWIKDCNQETLMTIIKAARNINGNYERMSDSTILKNLINGSIFDICHLKFDLNCLPDSYWMSLANHNMRLEDFPDRIKTREFFMTVAKKLDLCDVPEKYKDDELCVHYINQKIRDFVYAPKHILTYEMCEKYCHGGGCQLNQIPEHLLDYNLCQIYIYNGGDITKVPEHLIDQKLCELYAERQPNWLSFLGSIPLKFRNEKICNLVNVNDFPNIPEELKTQEKSIKYIQETNLESIFLDIIPEKFKNTEFWQAYVKRHGLRKVPKDILTQEICDKVPLEDYPKYYTSIPNKFRTKEHLVRMAKTNGIKHIPPKLITPELCNLAYENGKCYLHEIPEEYRTKELYLRALNKDNSVNLIPKEYLELPEFKEVIKEKKIWNLMNIEEMDFDEFTNLYRDVLKTRSRHIAIPNNFFRKNGLKAVAFWLYSTDYTMYKQFQKEVPEFAQFTFS